MPATPTPHVEKSTRAEVAPPLNPAAAHSRLNHLINETFPANSPEWREWHSLLSTLGEEIWRLSR